MDHSLIWMVINKGKLVFFLINIRNNIPNFKIPMVNYDNNIMKRSNAEYIDHIAEKWWHPTKTYFGTCTKWAIELRALRLECDNLTIRDKNWLLLLIFLWNQFSLRHNNIRKEMVKVFLFLSTCHDDAVSACRCTCVMCVFARVHSSHFIAS